MRLLVITTTRQSHLIPPASSSSGVPGRIRTCDPLLRRHYDTLKLLNKLSVSRLAELSNLSKAYISQVKHGIRPPSQRLIDVLESLQDSKVQKSQEIDYLALFLQSRTSMGVSDNTLRYYRERLSKFITNVDYTKASRVAIQRYLNSIPPNHNGLATRHASFRTIKTFYRWLNSQHGLPNPIEGMPAPILGKLILPSLTRKEVVKLIDTAENTRNKAIIALFTESGLRLTELTSIRPDCIDWSTNTIRILGKGRKEAYAPFGKLSSKYLREWFTQYEPNNGNIWGMNEYGIASMLKRHTPPAGFLMSMCINPFS